MTLRAKLPSARLEQLRSIVTFGIGPVLGIASGPVLARALAPEGRGQFAAIMQPISVAGAVASLGVPAAVTYFTARGVSVRSAYTQGVRCVLVPTSAVYLGMFVYSFFVSDAQGLPQWVVALCWTAVILSSIVQIRRGAWQGVARWRLLDIERGLFAVARFGAVVVVALLGVRFAGWYAAASLIAFVLAASVLWKALPTARGDQTAASRQKMTSYSFAASAGTISLFANNRIDQVMFPVAGSTRELGYYAVAVTVAEVPLVLGTLSARNALTLASRNEPFSKVLRAVRLYLGVGVLASIGLAVTAGFFVPLLFGEDFRASALSVTVLCLGTILAIANLVMNAHVSGAGRPWLGSLIPLAALVVTIAGFAVNWGSISSLYASYVATASQFVGVVVGVALIAGLRGSVAESNLEMARGE